MLRFGLHICYRGVTERRNESLHIIVTKRYAAGYPSIDSDCVPFHESFDPGAKYERFGGNDENGNPTTLFVDAINVQPWELCPPSAQAFSQASVGGAGMQAVYGPSASNLPVQQRDQPACPRNPTAS